MKALTLYEQALALFFGKEYAFKRAHKRIYNTIYKKLLSKNTFDGFDFIFNNDFETNDIDIIIYNSDYKSEKYYGFKLVDGCRDAYTFKHEVSIYVCSCSDITELINELIQAKNIINSSLSIERENLEKYESLIKEGYKIIDTSYLYGGTPFRFANIEIAVKDIEVFLKLIKVNNLLDSSEIDSYRSYIIDVFRKEYGGNVSFEDTAEIQLPLLYLKLKKEEEEEQKRIEEGNSKCSIVKEINSRS